MASQRLKKTAHWHGCRECDTRYEDNCVTRERDGLCAACRGGRPWQLLIDNASPKDCCIATARLVTKDEKKRYDLGGAHLWFICTTCKRTHPFDPRTPRRTRS